MDLAASIQAVTEEIVLRMGRDVQQQTQDEDTWSWPAAWR